MHFETLHVDSLKGEVVEARVGDEVFRGAVIDWKGYSKADTAWMFSKLDVATGAWPEAPQSADAWRLTGVPDEGGALGSYTLAWLDAGVWHEAAAWSSIDPEARQSILAPLDDVLTSVHSLLLIY